MPTYSYACTECENRFDAVQAFTDDALTTCPECSGRVRKLFNSVGVVFKGSGFYRTDSRAAANGSPSGEKTAGSQSATSAESNGESKQSADKASKDKPPKDKPSKDKPSDKAPAAATAK